MKFSLKAIAMTAVLSLSSPAAAQTALDIDADGNVTIPGTLTAGAITSDSLSWYVFADNLPDAMATVLKDPITFTTQNEFMMQRNSGMRVLYFSGWNSGLRVMTEPYMTGDSLTDGAIYQLGGSMWVTQNDLDPIAQKCPEKTVYHRYYYYTSDGVRPSLTDSNGCTTESVVYARKRSFK
ncbi:hypothetical protein [uncultured Tateyamaria sp.]|uniref:hypothetical protein n=1 Tax=uncultured Tateyamaria sp. TaxID=455651 RepID=UPI002610CE2E|nr:hypothetical protein [uncultured Tateyamaria sp.]